MSEVQDIIKKYEIAKEFSDDEESLKQKFRQKLINLKDKYIKIIKLEEKNIKEINDNGGYYKKMMDDIIELRINIVKQCADDMVSDALRDTYKYRWDSSHSISADDTNIYNKYILDFGLSDKIDIKKVFKDFNTSILHNIINSKKNYIDLLNDLLLVLIITKKENDCIDKYIKYIHENRFDTYNYDLYATILYKYNDSLRKSYSCMTESECKLYKYKIEKIHNDTFNLIKMLNSYYSNINDINSVKSKIEIYQNKIDTYNTWIEMINDILNPDF